MAVRPARSARRNLREVPRHGAAHRRDRRPADRGRHPLDGRRRQRRTPDPRRAALARCAHHHPLLRLHGLGGDDHRTGRIARLPRNLGQRPLPDPHGHLCRRRQRRRDSGKTRPAPPDRHAHRRGLCRPFRPPGRGVRGADGRKQRQRPLAIARRGRRSRARRHGDRQRGTHGTLAGGEYRPRLGAAARRHRAQPPRGASRRPQCTAHRGRTAGVAAPLGHGHTAGAAERLAKTRRTAIRYGRRTNAPTPKTPNASKASDIHTRHNPTPKTNQP